MKVSAGTNKSSRADKFTKETSEEPKEKANTLKIPEGAEDVSHTVKKIHNGYIVAHSYRHKGDYHHHEVYHAENPLKQEDGSGQEKDPFGNVGGIKSK